jgi:hypothetical protein
MIGASIGYFLILLTLVIFLSRCMIRNKLRAMQSPNIVYFLKKKVLQYLRGLGNEDEARRYDFQPPPPPPSYPRAMPIAPPPERRYEPYHDNAKPKYDQLVIPPPMPVAEDAMTEFPPAFDRAHTASEIKPSLAVPNF